MAKTIVEAKQALEDLRSGLGDLELMKKYNLSSRGLQSLFQQLGKMGLLKRLNAAEVLRDLRNGKSDTDIMKKYGLSRKGLQALFAEIDRTGLLERPPEKDTLPTKIVINVPEMVKDIRAGMGKSELMKKYSLTPRGLRWVSTMLVSSGSVGWHEIFGHICSRIDELVPDKLRESKRLRLNYEIPVYEMSDTSRTGVLNDLSEKGIGIRGLKAKVGETKTLVITGDEFGEYVSFAVDVVCKWVSKDPQGTYLGGFEIAGISLGGRGEFQLLMNTARKSGSA